MPGFTTKTSTDPGPFDALRPAGERSLERVTSADGLDSTSDTTPGKSGEPQKSTHSASAGADEDSELDHLYRFQDIPVTAEMRRELLGAKLPLATIEQLADTQPPHKSSLSAPSGSVPMGASLVDRHAPTEPALPNPRPPQRARDAETLKHERQLLDGDSYSTTAPTLLSVRRRRLRNQRYVLGTLAVMTLAILIGVAWRRYTRPPAPLVRAPDAENVKKAHIAGNRPGSPAPPRNFDAAAKDPNAVNSEPSASERANTDSQSAQLGSPATDATSSSPLSADSKSAGRDPQPASALPARAPVATRAAPTEMDTSSPSSEVPLKGSSGTANKSTPNKSASSSKVLSGKVEPGTSNAFDPEELIF
jgi:hypothetical protein